MFIVHVLVRICMYIYKVLDKYMHIRTNTYLHVYVCTGMYRYV
jgi:hypothetical protein